MPAQTKEVAEIVQTAAIVVGVAFAVYEFVIKDRDQKRQIAEITLAQAANLRSQSVVAAQQQLYQLHDLAFRTPVDDADKPMRQKVEAEFPTATRDLAHFYSVAHRCTASGYCDVSLMRTLICEDAIRDSTAVEEIASRVGTRSLDTAYFANLMQFAAECGKARREGAIP